jgi:lipid-A-disaccharide synthase
LAAGDLPLELAAPARVRVVTGSAPVVTRAADVAAVASGTATLDTALAGTPLVAVYRVSALTMALGRPLADAGFLARGLFSLPNLVLDERAIEELYQEHFTPEALARGLSRLLTDQALRDATSAAFARLERALGGPGAFDRIARAIVATSAGSARESGA